MTAQSALDQKCVLVLNMLMLWIPDDVNISFPPGSVRQLWAQCHIFRVRVHFRFDFFHRYLWTSASPAAGRTSSHRSLLLPGEQITGGRLRGRVEPSPPPETPPAALARGRPFPRQPPLSPQTRWGDLTGAMLHNTEPRVDGSPN